MQFPLHKTVMWSLFILSDEDEGLAFEVKSLDTLKSEKIAKAKQILGEFPVCYYGF